MSADRTGRPASSYGWLAFKVALFVAGASLLVYIGYRYVSGSHPAAGTLYGTIFPASALLGLAGMGLALRPTACSCQGGGRRRLLAGGLTVLAGVWMATGFLCVGFLARTTLETPLKGVLSTVHMTAQHVFLSLSVAALAWAPDDVARLCGARAAKVSQEAAEEPLVPGSG